VRSDGSDSNDGLSNTSGGAFLTIAKAVAVASLLDCQGYNLTIQVADGTYAAGAPFINPVLNALTYTIQGNTTTPANCYINATTTCFGPVLGVYVIIRGFRLQSTADCILANNGAQPNIGIMEFGSAGAGSAHVRASTGTKLQMTGPVTISGGAGYHLKATLGGQIADSGAWTTTLSGTPVFASAFAAADTGGLISLSNNHIWSGAATGPRYYAEEGSQIRLASTSFVDLDAWLPGDAKGTLASCQYWPSKWKNLLANASGRVKDGPAGTKTNLQFGLHNRWYLLASGAGAVALSTLADVQDGLPSMMRMANGATAQKIGYAQGLEGADIKHLRGRKVTLSGYVRSSITALRVAILSWNGTQDAFPRNVVNNWSSGTYTPGNFFINPMAVVAVAGIAVTADAVTPIASPPSGQVPTDCNNLVVMIWTSSNAAANTGYMDLVLQLEEGTVGTRFERRPVEHDRALCKRFFQTLTVQSENGSRNIPLVRMRATPTVTVSIGSAASVTPDGFELFHSVAAACAVTADTEIGV
jgi:hypothetical protein